MDVKVTTTNTEPTKKCKKLGVRMQSDERVPVTDLQTLLHRNEEKRRMNLNQEAQTEQKKPKVLSPGDHLRRKLKKIESGKSSKDAHTKKSSDGKPKRKTVIVTSIETTDKENDEARKTTTAFTAALERTNLLLDEDVGQTLIVNSNKEVVQKNVAASNIVFFQHALASTAVSIPGLDKSDHTTELSPTPSLTPTEPRSEADALSTHGSAELITTTASAEDTSYVPPESTSIIAEPVFDEKLESAKTDVEEPALEAYIDAKPEELAVASACAVSLPGTPEPETSGNTVVDLANVELPQHDEEDAASNSGAEIDPDEQRDDLEDHCEGNLNTIEYTGNAEAARDVEDDDEESKPIPTPVGARSPARSVHSGHSVSRSCSPEAASEINLRTSPVRTPSPGFATVKKRERDESRSPSPRRRTVSPANFRRVSRKAVSPNRSVSRGKSPMRKRVRSPSPRRRHTPSPRRRRSRSRSPRPPPRNRSRSPRRGRSRSRRSRERTADKGYTPSMNVYASQGAYPQYAGTYYANPDYTQWVAACSAMYTGGAAAAPALAAPARMRSMTPEPVKRDAKTPAKALRAKTPELQVKPRSKELKVAPKDDLRNEIKSSKARKVSSRSNSTEPVPKQAKNVIAEVDQRLARRRSQADEPASKRSAEDHKELVKELSREMRSQMSTLLQDFKSDLRSEFRREIQDLRIELRQEIRGGESRHDSNKSKEKDLNSKMALLQAFMQITS